MYMYNSSQLGQSQPWWIADHHSLRFLLQVHRSGPAGSSVLPGAAGSPRGFGRGRRQLEGGSEALAPDGPKQEASWEIQRQQRHRVPVRALQRCPRGGGPGDGTCTAELKTTIPWWHHVDDISCLAHLSFSLSFSLSVCLSVCLSGGAGIFVWGRLQTGCQGDQTPSDGHQASAWETAPPAGEGDWLHSQTDSIAQSEVCSFLGPLCCGEGSPSVSEWNCVSVDVAVTSPCWIQLHVFETTTLLIHRSGLKVLQSLLRDQYLKPQLLIVLTQV